MDVTTCCNAKALMPLRGANSDVVRRVTGLEGRVAMRMELVVRFDYGPTVPWVSRLDDGSLRLIAGAGHVVSVTNPAQIREYAELFKPDAWTPPSPAMRQLCELQTVRAGIVASRTKWRNRIGSGVGDSTATNLAAATIDHLTAQLDAIDKAIRETIEGDAELRGRRDLLLIGVGETLAAMLLTEMPEPGVLRRSGEMVAYAGLNPSHHRSGTSIDRPTRISKIGNATLRSSLYMPALSAMRYSPIIAALVARLRTRAA